MFKKGHTPWNKNKKGIHLSPETEFKEGHIPWLKGLKNPYSEEVLEKMSKVHKGKHHSLETEFKKGMTSWSKGLTAETDERLKNVGDKVRKALKGRKRPNISKALMGRKRPDLSKALIGRKLSEEHIKNCLRRRIPTSLEEKFQGIIDKYNLPYKYVGDGSFIIGKKNPDFINTNNEKIAIEVYARYYKLRNDETIEEWKEKRNKVFKEYGWRIIYFDETEVTERNVLNKIKKEVEKNE